jgi:hypothetical protein
MSFSVGIGIVTYNRKDIVGETIDRVRTFTRHPDAALVVADDGSTDGTLTMLRDKRVPLVTGSNMGIAWNKNRALFLLSQRLNCEIVILLEDDTQPSVAGWEAEWISAARRWGHVNYAADWMRPYFVTGSGTAEDPRQSTMVTAQCAAYASTALAYAGYFDPLFKGYGHEHVEHTRRLIHLGHGGTERRTDTGEPLLYKLIDGGLTVATSQSHRDDAQEQHNEKLAMDLMKQSDYCPPWHSDTERRQFRLEIENAIAGDPARFRLAPGRTAGLGRPPPIPGAFSPLFRPA